MHYFLTDNMKVSELCLGGDRVYLTHVPALVFLLDIVDVKEPRPVLVMSHRDPRVPRNHVTVNSQDGRLLEVHPRHLQPTALMGYFMKSINETGIFLL